MAKYVAIIKDYHEVWNMPQGGIYPIIFDVDNKEEAKQIIKYICDEKVRYTLQIRGISTTLEISCLEILTLSEFNLN